MGSTIRVDGSWPGPITLSAGWFRARARPWNETISRPMVRLDRGGSDFLTSVSGRLASMGETEIFSPALYPGSTRVWRRAGFADHASLVVMEKTLGAASPATGPHRVDNEDQPDWDAVLAIDRHAFEGFWSMSRLGLIEAYQTNRSSTLLTTRAGDETTGYAIVGSQWGIAYLHRIAVRPDRAGQGFGVSLLSASIGWGSASGARSMVLNVRGENARALGIYEKAGFTSTGSDLLILRHRPQ